MLTAYIECIKSDANKSAYKAPKDYNEMYLTCILNF